MNTRELFQSQFAHIGRVIVAFYNLAAIAFIQGACAALIFYALVEHSDGYASLLKVISAAFLVAGLALLGVTITNAQASFPTRCLIAFCVSWSASILVFVVKGAFIALAESSINRYGSLESSTYNWSELAIYIPEYFVLVFITAEGKRFWFRRKGTDNCGNNPGALTDHTN
jgi:hypothetical protein